ncbi:MAG TPA: shikimate kinase [Coleofasciculaceae cyanobacterium]
MQPYNRLYLTGFMGAGKSTIGKILAKRIGFRFYDTDALVMRGFGKPVSRIFQENGEEAFRRAEVMVLHEISKRNRVVASTGGGTLVRDETFSIARGSGTLIYLRAPIGDLYERVIFSPKDRPLIDVPEQESIFRERFEERRLYYEQSDITVDTVNRKPDDVVHEIMERLAQHTAAEGA